MVTILAESKQLMEEILLPMEQKVLKWSNVTGDWQPFSMQFSCFMDHRESYWGLREKPCAMPPISREQYAMENAMGRRFCDADTALTALVPRRLIKSTAPNPNMDQIMYQAMTTEHIITVEELWMPLTEPKHWLPKMGPRKEV